MGNAFYSYAPTEVRLVAQQLPRRFSTKLHPFSCTRRSLVLGRVGEVNWGGHLAVTISLFWWDSLGNFPLGGRSRSAPCTRELVCWAMARNAGLAGAG